jgi:hypothetical protein
MYRTVRCLVIVGLLIASTRGLSALSITGGVITNIKPGPDIYSAADATVLNSLGDPVGIQ